MRHSQDPIYFAPQRKLGGGWICWKDSPSPPPAPNYSAIAQQQGQANIDAARVQSYLSNPNITTPLGTRTVSYGSGPPTFNQAGYDAALKAYNGGQGSSTPGTGGGVWYGDQWSPAQNPDGSSPAPKAPNQADFWQSSGNPDQSNVDIKLSPEQQQLYDTQTKLSQGLLGLGQNSLDQTTQALSKPQDFSNVQDIADQSYQAQTARLDPQWQQQRQQQAATLANQGVSAGSEAYDNSMRVFNQGQNDAYTQARQQAINTMPQTFQLAAAQRMQPLTELNAIRSGAQPQMPQFQPFTGSSVQPAPVMQGAQLQNQYNMGLYNSQVGQQNSMMSGLYGIGGALGSALMNGGSAGFAGSALGSLLL